MAANSAGVLTSDRKWVGAKYFFLEARIGRHLADLGVDLRDDLRRRKQSVPGSRLKSRQAFRQRRYVRQQRQAFRRAHCEYAHLAFAARHRRAGTGKPHGSGGNRGAEQRK